MARVSLGKRKRSSIAKSNRRVTSNSVVKKANSGTIRKKGSVEESNYERKYILVDAPLDDDNNDNDDDDDDYDYDYDYADPRDEDDKDFVINEMSDITPHSSKHTRMEVVGNDTGIEQPSISTANPTEKQKRDRSKRHLSPLLDLTDVEPTTSVNFSHFGNTAYLSYQPKYWNPQFLYRLSADITLATIRENGSEGVGRIEIGQRLAMDTTTKPGNRRVSSFIVNVCSDNKDHIGQYQKMEGKIRCIKYFWKANSQPEKFIRLFQDFERLSGKICPFKMGQVVKFTQTNLSTLRISDVTLRRLNDLLDIVTQQPVVVTIHRVIKIINERENAAGYQFQIDKKSLMKCMKALEKEGLLHVYDKTIVTDSVMNKVQLMCHRDIPEESPEVERAIRQTIDEYHREGRVFPHGQLRFSVKKRASLALIQTGQEDNLLQSIEENCSDGVTLNARYQLLRLQNSRSAILTSRKNHKDTDKGVSKLGDSVYASEDGIKECNEQSVNFKQSLMQGNLRRTCQEDEASFLNSFSSNLIDISFTRSPLKDKSRKGGPNSEPSAEFGYQAKAIRCMAIHEVVFQLVHGHSIGTKPDVYDKFPPGQDVSTWPSRSIDELPVFVDEESPLRFICPLTPCKDVQRGWFMLQDLVYALPLSTFVLCVHVGKNVPRELIHLFLNDPIKRHICIGDLPHELRFPITKDKKVYRQLEHILLTLSAFGLMAIGKNPDPMRFTSAHSSVFFVCKKAILYDTSTSQRGYASVTPPISKYDKYVYEFNNQDDVAFYWHHLRAIVQSTPLSFRNDVNSEEISQNRHKKYSAGLFDKSSVMVPVDQSIDLLYPLEPHEGCAGFDSALYIHLKRHWDLNPRPNSSVSWFISRFRRQSDSIRKIIETRVANLQKDWNSYVRSLMPSDVELTKKKKIKASTCTVYPSTRAAIAVEPKYNKRFHTPKNMELKRKKRPLDSVDIVSEQSRVHVRSRFSPKEKDMLILIRAVGFFLNPVYRFWLDPTVLRDIMHEYVPESRSKTVQCLMAAGVREMVRPNRLAYLQRIVRNLSTFQEMRDLRFQLASSPLSTAEGKTMFFKNAFDIANRLLFMEYQTIPHVLTSNQQFESYLNAGKVVISAEQASANPMPLRSQRPSTLPHIHHCVAINILLSILIHTTDGAFSEAILDQISATVIHNALQVLRSDGLVSRSRILDPQLMIVSKSNATLSYYFRHFFSHRFHPDLVEQALQKFELLEDSLEGAVELLGDDAGLVIAASSSFYNNSDLEVSVDEEILSVFEQAVLEQQSTKQIRYLESADLRLEEVHVFQGASDSFPRLPSWTELVTLIDRSQPADRYPPVPFEDFILSILVSERQKLRTIHQVINQTGAYGASVEDIARNTKMTRDMIWPLLKQLIDECQIVDVGVDSRRWVTAAYSSAWCVVIDNKRICPRPWTMPTGGICAATVRWMAESALMTVVANPGIPTKDLHFRFEFALQPAALDDLITILEASGCLTLCEEVFESMQLSSPFQDSCSKTMYTYLLPSVDCIERFANIFGGVALLPVMTGSGRSDGEREGVARNSAQIDSSGILFSPTLTVPKVEKGT